MKRSLTLLLVLLLAPAVWQIGFRTPAPAAAQGPADSAAPSGEGEPDPFGDGSSPSSDDPFGLIADDDPFGDPRVSGEVAAPPGDSAPRGRRRGAADPTQPDERLAPYRRQFQLELTDIVDDGVSFQKVQVHGTASVAPKSLTELPAVRIATINVPGDYGMEMMYGEMDGTMYGAGEMDYADMYGGGMPSPSLQRLSEDQRRALEQRVTWQAQVDWVRRVLQSPRALEEPDREKLKKLIREVLKEQYTDQLRRQHRELQVVERRLTALREQLIHRARATDRVVDFELQRLDLEAGGFSLGPDVGLQPDPQAMSGFGGMM